MVCQFLNEILDLCFVWNASPREHSGHRGDLSDHLHGLLPLLPPFIPSNCFFLSLLSSDTRRHSPHLFSSKMSFGFWRKTASTFHLIIIIYSMIILIGLYIYQVGLSLLRETISTSFA